MKKFSVSRPYKVIKKFRVREPTPVERVKKALTSIISLLTRKKISFSIPRDKILIGIWIMLGLVFLFGPILYLMWLLNAYGSIEYERPVVHATLLSSIFGDYGNRVEREHAIIQRINITVSENATTYLESMSSVYPVSTNVYVLKGHLYDSGKNYDEFLSSLLYGLRQRGFSTSIVDVKDLPSVPTGSILIVPNGYPPEGFLEVLNETCKKKTWYIFYIGHTPTSEIDEKGSVKSSKEFWMERQVNFQPLTDVVPQGLKLISTTPYKVENIDLYRNFYTVLSIGKSKFVILPVPLDIGWKNGRDAAHDLLTVIDDLHWVEIRDTSESKVRKEVDYYISPPSEDDVMYVLNVVNASNGDKFSLYYISGYGFKFYPGQLYSERGPVLVPFSISKAQELFELYLEGEQAKVAINFIDDEGNVVDVVKPTPSGIVQPGTQVFFNYMNPSLKKGGYLIQVVDDKGNILDVSYVELGEFEVEAKPSIKDPVVRFSFFVNGKPVRINEVKVVFKGDEAVFRNVRQIDFNVEKFFGGPLPVGKHTFEVYIGPTKYDVDVVVSPRTDFARLLSGPNLILLTLSALIYGFGVFFVKKEEEIFYIDIPDFPPIESIKIPINTRMVVDVIEKVNEMYKWEYTPLTTDEIRRGFRMMTYNGSPIYASDFNVQYILEKLKQKGIVVGYGDYYGLKRWEKDSGFDIKQLALYRRIRDICVERAIPFTKLQRRKGYHVKLKVGWTEFYVFIYDPKEREFILKNAPSFIDKGVVVILFSSNEEKRKFYMSLNTGDPRAQRLRFYAVTNNVLLLTLEEFEERVKELKA